MAGRLLIVGPIVADSHLGGAVAWGWVAGGFGLGTLLGALIAIRFEVSRPMLFGTLSMFSFAGPLLLLSIPTPNWLIALSAVLAGVGIEIFGVYWLTALHTYIPPQALSRVLAYDLLGSIALAPLGEAFAGPLVEQFGIRPTLWIAAAFVIVLTALVLTVPEVRSLRSRV